MSTDRILEYAKGLTGRRKKEWERIGKEYPFAVIQALKDRTANGLWYFGNERRWCEENFGYCQLWTELPRKHFVGNEIIFCFKNEGDALAFKLTWSQEIS